jgi:hypothetical protein
MTHVPDGGENHTRPPLAAADTSRCHPRRPLPSSTVSRWLGGTSRRPRSVLVSKMGKDTVNAKSGTTRRIPIEPALRPVLSRLHQERGGEQTVLWMPDHEDRAILLRQHLEVAGVKRAELFTSDARRTSPSHDLRATGITWAAVRGDDPLRIKQRAGHSGFATTEIYIREVSSSRSFPPGLIGGRLRQGLGQVTHLHADFPANMVEQRGIEPRTSALRTQRSPS